MRGAPGFKPRPLCGEVVNGFGYLHPQGIPVRSLRRPVHSNSTKKGWMEHPMVYFLIKVLAWDTRQMSNQKAVTIAPVKRSRDEVSLYRRLEH